MIALAVRDVEGKHAELQRIGKQLVDEAFAVLYKQPKESSGAVIGIAVNTLPGLKRVEVIRVDRDSSKDIPDGLEGIQVSKDGKSYFLRASVGRGELGVQYKVGGLKGLKGKLVRGERRRLTDDSHKDEGRGDHREYYGHDDHQGRPNHRIKRRAASVSGQVLPPGSLADSFSRRELIPRGASAGFVIYEDHPNDWDAWSVHCHQVGQSLTLT